MRDKTAFFEFDENYLDRLANRDPDTERHFVEYFSPLLRAKVRQRLHSPQEADDLSQETFLRVLRAVQGRTGIEQPERLGAFVNAVCNNVLLEHFRKQSRIIQQNEDAAEPEAAETTVEDRLVAAETRAQVRELIGGLSPKDRDILRAIFLEERDKDAVCKEFRVNRDYLRVIVHRAKNRFRELMEGARQIRAASATKPAGSSHTR